MKAVKVKIGESQIRRARKGQCGACPNSVALYDTVKKHKLPWKAIRTTEQVIEFTDAAANERVQIPTPPRTATFLKMYDDGLVVDGKGNIKVREFQYVLHPDRSIRRKLSSKRPKYKADPTATPENTPTNQPVSAQGKAKKRSPGDRGSHASATRRRGTRGYDQHRAFLLAKPIDGEEANDPDAVPELA